ncbi:MAG: magnesium transporter [Clostridia bacterium]|nr:magnesium transporter [Clostridia bacterium]
MKEEVEKFIEEKRFNDLRKYLESMNSADFPSLFEEIEEEKIIVIYRILSKEKAAEVFAELDSDVQEKLINCFTEKELRDVINELFMDDTVDLIEEMPSNVVKRILKNIKSEDRKVINELLNYPEDSAGTIMTTEFVDLKEHMTVEQAFDKIRKIGLQKETVYNCYVLSADRKLKGIIDLKDLLIAEKDEKLKNIMNANVITTNTLEDKENIAKMFDKYNFFALPVVDKEKRLVGIITIDDAIDVLQEEIDEDFEKMAAITPSEDTYFKTSVFTHARNRIVWLIILMLSSIVTGAIITKYENAFAAVPILVAFIPMIMGTTGNCGSQTSTLIIRGMSNDEIELKDYLKAVWKEFRVAILVALMLGIANGLRIWIQYKDLNLAIVIALSLLGTVILAKFLGCSLPMLAKKLKIDPALMATPVITTISDMCSVLIFFKIATLVMGLDINI